MKTDAFQEVKHIGQPTRTLEDLAEHACNVAQRIMDANVALTNHATELRELIARVADVVVDRDTEHAKAGMISVWRETLGHVEAALAALDGRSTQKL
jgi:hypothetical protein